MKYIPYLLLFLLFFSCKGQKPQKVDSKDSIKLLAVDKETEEHYPEEYRAFINQKHRIEVLNCEIYYNGKELIIGDSIQKIYKSIGQKIEFNSKRNVETFTLKTSIH